MDQKGTLRDSHNFVDGSEITQLFEYLHASDWCP